MSSSQLLAEVLRLPREERTRIVRRVLSSLEEPEEPVARAWGKELKRRSGEVARRKVRTVSWEKAEAEVLRDLGGRRGVRASSLGA